MKRRAFCAAGVLATTLCVGGPVATANRGLAPCGPGRFVPDHQGAPARVQGYFLRRSYAAGETARLVVTRAPRGTTLQIFHADVRHAPPRRPDAMSGVAVDKRIAVHRGTVAVEIGNWPTGVYFARLVHGGDIGFAPFILRPSVYGQNDVAVVIPTNTWQAESFMDQDRDGYGDTWYADPRVDVVSLARPFLHRGVPPRFGHFQYWMWEYGKHADFLSDDDLDAFASAAQLFRLYRLIIFAGHEEYATLHEFDLTMGYRNLGGNLAFLSSNSFYSQVVRRGNTIRCVGHFRDEGRPEAALIGVQYLDWNHGVFRNEPYRVVGAQYAPWFFRGTGLRDGKRFGYAYGVEIDALAPASPPGIHVLAELPNIFGRGRTAQMTYYVAPSGAKVFASGAFNFESSQSAVTDRLLLNLWAYFTH